MGLSDEERMTGMYRCISDLYKKGLEMQSILDGPESYMYSCYDFDKSKMYTEIVRMTTGIWHTFLTTHGGNTGMWLFGSRSRSPHNETAYDTFSAGMRAACYKKLEHIHEDEDDFSAFCKERDNTFDATKSFLSMKGLLGVDKLAQVIYEISLIGEGCLYYLRRYKDELSDTYVNVERDINTIFGITYALIADHPVFAKAYLISQVAEAIYENAYPMRPEDYDTVTKWLVDNHMHHDMSRMMANSVELEKVAEVYSIIENGIIRNQKACNEIMITYESKLFGEIYLEQRWNRMDFRRLIATIILAGERFHYKHKHKDLLERINADKDLKWCVGEVKEELKLCRKGDEDKRRERNRLDWARDRNYNSGALFGEYYKGIAIADPYLPDED